jgi:3-isopropylmalate/(R)-2-methylmalate dehydratase small subunit
MMGRAWIFGDNVSTDYIIPGRFNITNDPKELRKHVFKYIRPEFAEKVKVGDVLIGAKNFGCGSSREHAAIVIREAGVYLVAQSYGWIFRRNCVNLGVLPLQSEEPVKIQDGNEVEIDLANSLLKDSTGKTFKLMPTPKIVLDIHRAGGLVEYLNSHKEYST